MLIINGVYVLYVTIVYLLINMCCEVKPVVLIKIFVAHLVTVVTEDKYLPVLILT